MDLELISSTTVPDHYHLIVDGEPLRLLPKSLFGWRKIKLTATTPLELTLELAALEYRGIKRFLLRRLSAQSYHTIELRQSLEKKGASEENIARALAEFVELGYLNDAEWLAAFVRRLQREKKGGQWILMKLKSKGIPQVEIDAIRFSVREREEESIERLLATRYRSRNLADHKEKQKVISSLARRGFSLSNILDKVK